MLIIRILFGLGIEFADSYIEVRKNEIIIF